jgi:signal transduction histidine kinase
LKSILPLKIVIPLVLGIVASLAVAVYAELGFRRLEAANRQVAASLEMQTTLFELLTLIVDAETGQRGYLLTGRDEYLQPYTAAAPKIESAMQRLRELLVTHGTVAQRDALGRINGLVGKKIAELESTIALRQGGDATTAQALIDTGMGRRTMDSIRAEVDGMTATHKRQLDEATRRWATDIDFARLSMEALTAFTVLLLVLVWMLTRRETQYREERRLSMQEDKQRLEGLVEERTAALSELSNHLQVVREDEKSKLARDLHDELGGIMVSAKMDVAWVEKRLKATDPEAASKLARAQQALDDGVQIKRRIIEELRPTLLDNLGLSAALEWQVHEICDAAGLKSTIETPSDDTVIPPTVAIALYRILQEALTNIVKYARAKNVNVDLAVSSDNVSLVIEDDGVGIPDKAQTDKLSHGIAGMRQRVRALRGEFSIERGADGGTVIEVNIPLATAGQSESVAAPAAR